MHQNSIAFRFLHGFVLTLFITAHAAGADTPTAAELEPLGLEVRWNSQAVIDVNRDVVTHVSNEPPAPAVLVPLPSAYPLRQHVP